MLNYLKNSILRKIARRVTKEYPIKIDTFSLRDYGVVKFANWENPLVEKKEIKDENIDFFKKFIKKGDFVIDIGANIGHMTMFFALICGKEGLTLAFDPNPYVFKILQQNAELNLSITNILTYNCAITDVEDEFYYNSSEASFNNGGISKEKQNNHGKFSLSKKIKGINLESFLKSKFAEKLPNLRLIKIDTEGYDKEIIKSISNLLIKYKPIVISECFGKSTQTERFEHYDLLKSKGYSLYYFNDFVNDTQIIPIAKKEDMLNWKHFDFYAIIEK
ncbi:MAG: FkbM family methyltransferase [Bacteroidota bacterium]